MSFRSKPVFLFFLYLMSLRTLAAKDVKIAEMSDDSALRLSLAKTWFIEPPVAVLRHRPIVRTLDSGERVQIRAEQGRAGSDEFSIIIEREQNGAFNAWAQGSFILTRRLSDGEALRARVFLRSDRYTYVQFRPLGDHKSEMDAVVYDAFIAQTLPIPIEFKRLLTSPLTDALTGETAAAVRRYYEPDPDDNREKRAFLRKIRSSIKTLEFGDDGAIDENGDYVYIATLEKQGEKHGLNCSGFAKWVIDALISPISGKKLPIAPLKEPYGNRGSTFTRPFERIRDPYFGLDWVRNLAAAAGTAFMSSDFANLQEIEARSAPFSAIQTRAGRETQIRSYPGHLDEAGFGFEGILPLLYTLAINEPRSIFLGAINTVGGRPPMRTYVHIAVLVPYFDEDSVFRVAVFESAEETSFNRFRVRYPDHYISLCRVPASAHFEP
ncbi:MAG: LXG domain-containing protein [Spirochaetaceae bacterium]|jgi:hypothetical protein|nr:LXG domain-containing protein [Spirochaetaceae bacterium]